MNNLTFNLLTQKHIDGFTWNLFEGAGFAIGVAFVAAILYTIYLIFRLVAYFLLNKFNK